ncbi:MAG: phosphoglycolate phosphatase [Sulfitobacter sp.]
MSARIVFDLDGTLIDSAPDIRGVANRLLRPHGAQITLAQTHSFIGNGVDVFVARMLDTLDLNSDLAKELVPEFKRAYLVAVHETVAYPHVFEALDRLLVEGHRLGLCTNKPLAPCMAVLDHLSLTGYFETVWGGDSLEVHKPDPAPLNAAFDALGDGPCLYVGDSEVDAETAQSAAVPFLLFTEGYRKTDVADIPHTATFSEFDDLPALVTRYAGSR